MNQFQAAQEGNLQWFQESTYDIDAIDDDWIFTESGARLRSNETALTMACGHNQPKVARFLLQKGADPNIKASSQTALMFAAESGMHLIVSLLISKGARINEKDSSGATALLYAVTEEAPVDEEHNSIKVVSALIAAGADVSVVKAQCGHTPLTEALMNMDNSVAASIILKAVINQNKVLKKNPIVDAAELEDFDIVELLLDAGADPSVQGSWGRTALMYACGNGKYDLASRMISIGAKDDIVNMVCDKGETALLWAVEEGYVDICSLLVSSGADLELRDCYGNNPLMRAVQTGKTSICRVLLEAGALPNVMFAAESIPINIAVDKNKLDICRMLISRGSRFPLRCRKVKTVAPLMRKFKGTPRTLKYNILGLRVIKKLAIGNMQLRKWNTYEREVAIY